MKKEKLTFWAAFLILPFIIILSMAWAHFKSNNSMVHVTPRDMNGIDTIRVMDSLYIINFEIVKVIPDTVENLSQDKYDTSY